MTWLDLVCVGFVLLAGAGGYAQGFLRGILRLLALLLGGALAGLVVARLDPRTAVASTLAGAIGTLLLAIAAAGVLAWQAARGLPRAVHESLPNRVLGILPALLIALLMLALLLGLVERVVISTEAQLFIRDGLLTGPLVAVVDTVEQTLAGVR